MAGLPILILLVTAILLWLMRRSHIRLLWPVTVVGIFSVWLSSLILTYAFPFQIVIFRGFTNDNSALLKLDLISWPFVFILATLLLSSLFTTFADRDDFGWKPAFQLLLMGAAGLAATLAGNVLGFVLTWTVLDLTILAIRSNNSINEFKRVQELQNFGLRSAATTLLIAAELMNRNSSGAEDLADIRTLAVFGLLFAAVLLRTGLFADSEEQQLALPPVHTILSTAAGFSLLARVLSIPIHPSILDEFKIAGAVFAGLAIIALLVNRNLRLKSYHLGLVCLGVVLLMEAHSQHSPGQIAASVGVLLILSAGASQIRKPNRTWIFVIGAIAFMFAGMPGTFGRVLTESATIIIQGQNAVSFWLLAPLVLILYGARRVVEGLDRSEKAEQPDRKPSTQTTFGMLLLPFSGFAIVLVEREITLKEGPFFAAMAGAMMISVFVLRRRKEFPIANPNFASSFVLLHPIRKEFIRTAREFIRGSARLFEGATGMLWVYVILLFLLLASGLSN